MKIRDKLGRFTSEGMKGENNPKWKGDGVGYFGLHSWIQRELGESEICIKCGSNKKVQWANKSKEYKRDLKDWISLCVVCHRRYDGITKFSRKTVHFIREKLKQGEKQIVLAKKHKVNPSTISNIFRNKIQYYG